VTGRHVIVAMLAAALALPAFAFALPKSAGTYMLGPRMIRAEIALRTKDGVSHDYWLHRGRLAKRYSAGTLVVVERDGTKPLKTLAAAHVTLNGKPSTLKALRAGMQVLVSYDGNPPVDTVYAATKGAPRLPHAVSSFLLGPRMMRAEIPLQSADGVNHDYRLDQGRIRQLTATSLVLHEADGTNTTPIDVSPTVSVKLNGQDAGYFQLKRGMIATVIRDGDKPADQIFATGK
jgi:hypothetical protein